VPLKRRAPEADVCGERSQLSGGALVARILLVDDDPDIRFVARMALRKGKHEVVEAQNGREALEWLGRGEKCDLVICDRMMPVMNGIEVLTALNAMQLGDHLGRHLVSSGRFVFLTAKAQASEVDEGLRLGAAAYFTKPFEPRELLASVEKLLARPEA
jgi:CheY-like chemotaxis protein